MMKYKLVCMSFNGDYIVERPVFNTVDDAWNYSNDLGSKWFFYPFHFITDEEIKTVVDTPDLISHLKDRCIDDVAALFKETSQQPELQNVSVEEFLFNI